MTQDNMPIIVLHGSAAERGHQHGVKLRGSITQAFADLTRSMLASDLERARASASTSLNQLSAIGPDVYAEIEGIAAATGLSLLDIYLLSFFELLSDCQTGCTSAGLATAHGAVVAQNWDAPVNATRDLFVIVHKGNEKQLITIASAGTLGWVGMNENGVAFVNNDLMLDTSQQGLPSLAIRRMILARNNVEGAIDVLRSNQHMSGRCFLLGDASGKLEVAEVGPSLGLIHRSMHEVVHTNHPLFPEPAMWENIEATARYYPSSRDRLRAARRFILNSTEDMVALLRDRSGAPDAICKSISGREPTATAFSIIFDCGQREAMVALGRPDLMSYQRITLKQVAEA